MGWQAHLLLHTAQQSKLDGKLSLYKLNLSYKNFWIPLTKTRVFYSKRSKFILSKQYMIHPHSYIHTSNNSIFEVSISSSFWSVTFISFVPITETISASAYKHKENFMISVLSQHRGRFNFHLLKSGQSCCHLLSIDNIYLQ